MWINLNENKSEMKEWDEDELEKFIRENKDKFNIYHPDPNHNQHFLKKLLNKFREVISIVPYLVKVGIATILVFALSFLLWKIYLCPPLTRVSFKYWKVEHDYRRQINKNTRLAYTYITNPQQRAEFETELQKFDESYLTLKKQLKENPSTDNISAMLRFYQEKTLALQETNQNYGNEGVLNR